MKTAVEQVRERLERMKSEGMYDHHFTWGPDAASLTEEQRAEEQLKWLDVADEHRNLPMAEKMRIDITLAYGVIRKVMRGEARPIELDIAALHLGNWISPATRRMFMAPEREQS